MTRQQGYGGTTSKFEHLYKKLISSTRSGSKFETNGARDGLLQPERGFQEDPSRSTAGDTPKRSNKQRTMFSNKVVENMEAAVGGLVHMTVDGFEKATEEDRMETTTQRSDATVSHTNLGDANSGGFITIGKNGKPNYSIGDPNDKAIGIRISRDGKRGETAWSNQDIYNLMQLITAVDSGIHFMNFKANNESSVSVGNLATMKQLNWKSRLDIQTEPWGHPSANQERTHICFYIVTNKISPNLKELREDRSIKEFLNLGGCVMSQTRLKESRSKMVKYILDKNPNHTHRDAFASRIEDHLQYYTTKNKRIPVNVVNVPVTGGERILGLSVGGRDEQTVVKILKDHPFPHLEMIAPSLRRSNGEQFEHRIQQHAMVMSQTKAFKVSNVPHDFIPDFRDMMFNTSSGPVLVDVSEANHSRTTGVVYIQYLQDHRATVLQDIATTLEHEDFKGAELFDPDASVAMTANTKEPATHTIPSRFANFVNLTAAKAPSTKERKPTQIPKTIRTKPKSFSEALMKSLDDTYDSGSSQGSNTSTLGTAKTAREIELEEENQSLKTSQNELQQQLQAAQAQNNNWKAQFEQQQLQFQAQMSNMSSMLEQQQRTFQQKFDQQQQQLDTIMAKTMESAEEKLKMMAVASTLTHSPNRTPQDKLTKRPKRFLRPDDIGPSPSTNLNQSFDQAAQAPTDPKDKTND